MDREIPKEVRARARRKTFITYGAIAAAVIAVVVVLTSLMRTSLTRKDVIIVTADQGSIETTVSATGKVVPAFEEIINSPINTRIVEIYCKAGDSVGAGTPLLRLDLQSTETELNKLMDQIEMKRYELEQQRINNDTRLSDLDMQIKVKAMAVNRMEVEIGRASGRERVF